MESQWQRRVFSLPLTRDAGKQLCGVVHAEKKETNRTEGESQEYNYILLRNSGDIVDTIFWHVSSFGAGGRSEWADAMQKEKLEQNGLLG